MAPAPLPTGGAKSLILTRNEATPTVTYARGENRALGSRDEHTDADEGGFDGGCVQYGWPLPERIVANGGRHPGRGLRGLIPRRDGEVVIVWNVSGAAKVA